MSLKQIFIIVIILLLLSLNFIFLFNNNEIKCKYKSTEPVIQNHYYLGYYEDDNCNSFIKHPMFKINNELDKKIRINKFIKDNGSKELEDDNFINFMLLASHEYNIKWSTPICIMFADTNLGNQSLTKNNPGNIGNNDRGDKVHFKNRADGFLAILYTLNNQYLNSYNNIGELSGGGRKDLKLAPCTNKNTYCYASSVVNWNRNVLNCLRFLENDSNINSSWKFRF
jgi:hypothetical protein